MQSPIVLFHLRWVFWGIGLAFLVALVTGYINRNRDRIETLASQKYGVILACISGAFFVLGIVAKVSQWWTLNLNAQDFWLFVDILEQSKSGGVFLSRFAPQGLGFVQHGSVHPMWTWGLLTPLASVIGAVPVALAYGPFVLSAAAVFLALLTRKKWGSWHSLLFCVAFLASTQVGKIIMYDVHPEAAYPLFVFLWFWAMGWDGTNRVRWGSLILATLLAMGMKEDSFLVMAPWFLWGILSAKGVQQRAALLSAVLGAFVLILGMISVSSWVSGYWGPSLWKGEPVYTQGSSGVFRGLHWSDPGQVVTIFRQLVADHGSEIGSFFVSRPWLSLLIFAPWVVLRPQFWWVIFPLAFAYSLLEGPRNLWNYYSAPFLASFWFCATRRMLGTKAVHWTLLAALFLGSSSAQIFWPTSQVKEIRAEVRKLSPYLGKRGLVAPHLLGLVPLEKVWTDRLPRSEDQWDRLDFVLISLGVSRFELSQNETQQILERVSRSPEWHRVDDQTRSVVLYFRGAQPRVE